MTTNLHQGYGRQANLRESGFYIEMPFLSPFFPLETMSKKSYSKNINTPAAFPPETARQQSFALTEARFHGTMEAFPYVRDRVGPGVRPRDFFDTQLRA